MRAIYKRELGAFFHSVIGWLFLAVNLFFAGLYYTALNLTYGSPSFAGTVSSILFLLIITIPVLSMRILSEERKQKTDQLILTAPVSVARIVIGKYLAVATVFGISVLVMAGYPLLLGRFGAVSYQESYTALLGYLLYGLAGIAIGLFLSSLTESQVIAAVLSFGVLFLTYMMSGITGLISQSGNWLTDLLGAFDFMARFQTFLQAKLDAADILYFLSVILFMLFLTCQSIQKRRWSVSVKIAALGAYNTTAVLIVCILTVLVNLMAVRLPAAYRTVDMTSQKLYSLSDQTKKMLDGLQEDVTIYVLQSENSKDSIVNNTLENYCAKSGHIKVEYVDPIANPNFHTQYTSDEGIAMNSLIVESGRRYKVIPYSNIYETEYDYYSYSATTTGYDGEGQITSAIAYVTGEDMPKIYTVTGHNELELSETFLNSIRKANLEVAQLNLLEYDSVPEDAQCVIINAPTQDLSLEDTRKLMEYAGNGGNLFVTTAFTNETLDNFQELLSYYGAGLEAGMVMEESRENYYQSPYYLLPEIAYDDITAGLKEQNYIFMPYAQGVTFTEQEGVTVTELLTSSDQSYSKVSFDQADALTREEGDIDGPFTLALKAVKQTGGEKASTLLLFGSEALFADSANEAVAGNNLSLFSQALASVTTQTESIFVPVKAYGLSQIIVPSSVSLAAGGILTILLPSVLLIIGVVIWLKRRKY